MSSVGFDNVKKVLVATTYSKSHSTSTQINGNDSETSIRYICTTEKIGKGSYSKVYKGWICKCSEDVVDDVFGWQCDCDLDKVEYVAIKKMCISKAKHRKVLDNEIEILKKLNHPNIVNFIDMVEFKDDMDDNESTLYIILEYCGGGDLKHYLDGKKLKEKYAKYYFRQIAKGLEYLHGQSIVHRDLKPHNILISSDKRIIKIADFGFAKILGSDSLAETICGSPSYMAPEIMKVKTYNNKADLWSIGLIMYEALTGRHPYKSATTIFELMEKIDLSSKQVLSFPKKTKLSEESRDLLRKLLLANPDDRMEWKVFFQHPFFQSKKTLSQSSHRLQLSFGGVSLERSSITEKTHHSNTIHASSVFTPPSFVHSPRDTSTKLNIIENYENSQSSQQYTNSRSYSQNFGTSAPVQSHRIPITKRNQSMEKTNPNQLSYISEYIGTSWSLIKDSFKAE